jgi:hypothetical protein
MPICSGKTKRPAQNNPDRPFKFFAKQHWKDYNLSVKFNEDAYLNCSVYLIWKDSQEPQDASYVAFIVSEYTPNHGEVIS